MPRKRNGGGGPTTGAEEPSGSAGLDGGELWIGRHSGDRDILVLDPGQTDASAAVVTLYSLGQHRPRAFPRGTLREKIRELKDDEAFRAATAAYANREALRESYEQGLAESRLARMQRQRDAVVAAHRKHLDALGLAYEGVTDSANGRRRAKPAKCHACGIELDDFVGLSCAICARVLCSCGSCACGKRPRSG
jgi:hypothetical protein